MSLISQSLPESVNLLKSICPDIIEEKVTRAINDSRLLMGQVMELATNLKRKDFCGKLKELIGKKHFTYPFVFRKKISPCILLLETIGDNRRIYTCVIPTQLEAAMTNKEFFIESDMYLFANLSICVTRDTPAVIFLVATVRTRSRTPLNPVRSFFDPRPAQTKPGLKIEASLSFLNFDVSTRISSVCIPLTSLKQLPERMISVKGYVAEVMATSSNNRDSNFKNVYNHTTYFVKVYQILR